MEEFVKQKLLKKVKDNNRQEQRLLLQYILKEDKELIEEARRYIQKDNDFIYTEKGLINRPSFHRISRLQVMVHHIKAGKWELLLKGNENNLLFSHELVALYCEAKISLDELGNSHDVCGDLFNFSCNM